MTRHLLTRRILPTLVVALSLGAAGTAQATTSASVDTTGKLTISGDSGSNLVSIYKIAPEADTGTTSGTHEVIIVKDGDASTAPSDCSADPTCPLTQALQNRGVLPGANCAIEDANTLKCTPAPKGPVGGGTSDGKFISVSATLGAGSDIFNEYLGTDERGRATSAVLVPVTTDAGDGDDSVFGTAGKDTITGGNGDDDLRGGAGDDKITPGAGSNKVSGGDGTDTVDFADQSAGRAISLDDLPDDGANCTLDSAHMGNACAKENIHSDVENITTGSGNDLISAGPGRQRHHHRRGQRRRLRRRRQRHDRRGRWREHRLRRHGHLHVAQHGRGADAAGRRHDRGRRGHDHHPRGQRRHRRGPGQRQGQRRQRRQRDHARQRL